MPEQIEASIACVGTTSRGQVFRAVSENPPCVVERNSDPEHAFCRALVAAGVPDGPILFWRAKTPSLRYPSIHRAAKVTVRHATSSGFRVERYKQFDPERRRPSASGQV